MRVGATGAGAGADGAGRAGAEGACAGRGGGGAVSSGGTALSAVGIDAPVLATVAAGAACVRCALVLLLCLAIAKKTANTAHRATHPITTRASSLGRVGPSTQPGSIGVPLRGRGMASAWRSSDPGRSRPAPAVCRGGS
jgi:hypothetical protein